MEIYVEYRVNSLEWKQNVDTQEKRKKYIYFTSLICIIVEKEKERKKICKSKRV